MYIDNELQELSDQCVNTFELDDIIEHLEEELTELLLAIKRVRRRKEELPAMLEEMMDVMIELNTVLTAFDTYGVDLDKYEPLFESKVAKFKAMLVKYERKEGEKLKNRYISLTELEELNGEEVNN